MAKRKTRLPELVRQDGGLCTHFVNTGSGKRPALRSYADLLIWGQRAEVLGGAGAQRLERAAGERPADAETVLARALELRARLERILLALAGRRNPAVADLDAVAGALGAAASAHRFVPAAGGGFLLGWGDGGGDDLDRVLWPVLTSAAEVLAPESYHRVGQCAGEDCPLFFVDRSPGSPRKWCRRCGARARSRRHYQRVVKAKRQQRKAAREARRRERGRQAKSDDEPSGAGPAVAKRTNRVVA